MGGNSAKTVTRKATNTLKIIVSLLDEDSPIVSVDFIKPYMNLSELQMIAEVNAASKVISILERIKHSQTQVEAQAPVEPPISYIDEIKKLKELLDIGAITQDEFDDKKKNLLN